MATVATAQDPLATAFKSPPQTAKPRVWWHWMNSNVSISGIDQDFAWMKRVGIGGVQNFDGSLNTPRLVQVPSPYMSEGWRTAFKHAVTRADSLGLEFTIASSPGWSETGGPWVKPEQAMKKLVWSERVVQGGVPVAGPLPAPPAIAGTFQDIAAAGAAAFSGVTAKALPTLYRDAAVVAYRIPVTETEATARVTASSAIDLTGLADGDRAKRIDLPFGSDSTAWVQFAYDRPTAVRALTIVAGGGGGRGGGNTLPPRILASDDGTTFRTVADLPRGGAPQSTISFPAVTARYFRVLFRQPAAGGGGGFGGGGRGVAQPVTAQQLAELTLSSGARVHRFEDKAGWSHIDGLEDMPTPPVPREQAVARRDVIDVSSHLKPDGSLDWTPPPGRWNIVRLGWSLAGTLNRPASPEGTGLEVDKLSADHVRAYLDSYLSIYKGALGDSLIGKRGLRYMLTDSYEAAASNWTDNMIAEFQRRRGYDPRPWLPVLTGRVVESAPASDRFLWDFRRTLSDLIADNHYAELSKQLHRRGMGRYGESHETSRAFIGDGMEVKKSADIPMGATWQGRTAYASLQLPDIRESASVSHLYGQNLVAAESFTVGGGPTTSYAFAPDQIKPTADRMLANGLNRFVIHTSVHQPLDSAGPGIGLGPFGQWFTRKETWAEQAGPWVSYLARSSHMLQQGRFAADIAYLYGEDENITALFERRAPAVPSGYAFDYVNADAVRNLLAVKNGRITAPSGASYRMLVLDQSTRRMTLATLRKIRELVRGGAVVVGAPPVETPSLADDDAQFKRLAEETWQLGARGRNVFATVDEALAALHLSADLDFHADTSIAFVHRKLADGDIYFVTNLGDRDASAEMTFRVAGKAPELWRADDGSMVPLSYRTQGSSTVVPLAMPAHEAVFVVFRTRASAPSRQVADAALAPLMNLTGPWSISFPPDRGAPESITLPSLVSWTENTDAGVKYFSGTATYRTSVQVPAGWTADGARVLLDLGAVKNVAEVRVNGRPAGIAWKAPFRVDVTDALKIGVNTVEIGVSNLWPNRLIGDKQPGVTRKYAFAVSDPYRADSPLLPSGLLGPVQLFRVTRPQ
jgi:Glycosyl hydrolases family 2, sugar binding domain./F5/8 type C domain.